MAERHARRHVGAARLTQPAAPVVALRESSIASLAAHGLLDADQVAAAMRFREAWEKLVACGHPGYLLERVDVVPHSTFAERADAAQRQLERCRNIAGVHGFRLLIKVCGEGYHIRDLYGSRRDRDTATDVLRIQLSAIARLAD
jgi:hypothetical protein